jgi:branched-subunit amino acid transport protein
VSLPEAYVWSAIAGLGVVVFATRNLFVALPRRFLPGGALERALRFAPLAALVALTVPAAAGAWLGEAGGGAAAWADPRLPAAVAALAASRAARSPFAGLAAGIATMLAIGGLS